MNWSVVNFKFDEKNCENYLFEKFVKMQRFCAT